jgi:hypothetical protein
VHEALALERFVDLVSAKRCFSMVLGAGLPLRKGTCRFALLERRGGVCWDAIVGRRAVSLYFLTLLASRDDDIMCIPTNVDYIAEVTIGVVVVITLLFLLAVGDALMPKHLLLV